VPVLLGGIFKATNNKSPAETLAGIKNKREFHAVETERFVRRFGVAPYTMNPFFPVNTLNLMRAAVAAQFEGVFENTSTRHFITCGPSLKKMERPRSGDEGACRFRPGCRQTVRARARARRQGEADREHPNRPWSAAAFGSPTFFVGQEMFFGKEQLREVEELVSGSSHTSLNLIASKAKQSILSFRIARWHLLRRFAPRNDEEERVGSQGLMEHTNAKTKRNGRGDRRRAIISVPRLRRNSPPKDSPCSPDGATEPSSSRWSRKIECIGRIDRRAHARRAEGGRGRGLPQ